MAFRSSMYTWERQKHKPVFSTRGNVQEWVKQVQEACDDAAKDIFGDNEHDMLGRKDFYVDDDAILEGQDLIDSWLQKKNVDDILAECEMQDEVSTISLPLNYNKKQLSLFNQDDSTLLQSSLNCSQEDKLQVQNPVFEIDEDFDEESAVHDVVYNMLERDVVDINSLNNELIMKNKTKKFKDPTPKMKLRHEQVKKRANQKKVAWEKANLKKMNEKTVEEEARKQLQREEKQRLENIKREEEEIRKEMVKIRRVMQDENTQRAKHKTRVAKNDEMAKSLAKEEVRKYQEEYKERLRRDIEAKEKLREKLLKQQEVEERRKQSNLKLLHSCFSSWYGLIVEKQIKCGKARALLQWRQKLRIWNAWRTYVLRSRSDRETRALNEQMKERHRKEVLADRFYCQMLFHRCLTSWYCWVEKAKEERMIKEQHNKRAEKMASLLEAASSGQLCQDTKTEAESTIEHDKNDLEHLEEISLKPFKLQDIPKDSRKALVSSRSVDKRKHIPRQAWPHQKLKEMKTRKPVKKQNALLENIGVFTSRTENSTATLQDNKVSCLIDDSSGSEKTISRKRTEQMPLSKNKNINSLTESEQSGIVENNDTSVTAGGIKRVDYSESSQSTRSTLSSYTTNNKSRITSKKPPTKPLHLAMEERAKERAERKSLLNARKRAAEEEKLAKLKQEQEEKEKEILAEKQAALQRKREEIKQAKQHELEKQQRLEEIKQMNNKADEHYHKTLLKNCGLLPWKKLIQTRDAMIKNAEIFHKRKIQIKCFREWLVYTRSECRRRSELADSLYKSLLLRRGWQSWKKYRNHLTEMENIALEFSQCYIIKKYVKIWKDFVIEERLLYWDKENRADEHNDRRLLRKAMTYWKKYIPLLREEEKHEKRRSDLRKHVISLLPDFQAVHHSP